MLELAPEDRAVVVLGLDWGQVPSEPWPVVEDGAPDDGLTVVSVARAADRGGDALQGPPLV